tara:strand:+ start:232 stop:855 length:624 start_codon:yes stop_codon:yes gene_type:complete
MSDANNLSYWENQKVTSEEKVIVKYLKNNITEKGLKILHIGIGSSYLLLNLHKIFSHIYGVTIAGLEKTKADNYKIINNSNYIIDKYNSKKLKQYFKPNSIDYIVDINLKSFAPDKLSFVNMFRDFSNILTKNGTIITAKSGMDWTTMIEEVNGTLYQIGSNSKNVLSRNELYVISNEHDLSVSSINIKYGFMFKKNEELFLIKKRH